MDLRKPKRGMLCVFGLTLAVTSAFSQKTQITAYVDGSGGQHVFYADTNSHLNQLYYSAGTTWQAQDLTAAYGGNTSAANGPMTSFIDSSMPAGQHVFYVDSNMGLNQLYYPGTGTTWITQDLASFGAPVAGTSLASFFYAWDGTQHVFYVDPSNDVDQLYYPGTGTSWVWQSLTSTYGGTAATSSSGLAAFIDDPPTKAEHIAYVDANGHISQLYYPGSGTMWFPQDLTATFGGTPPDATSNLTAYHDTMGGQHIVYVDSNQHLSQLYYPGSGTTWLAQDLTATQGGNMPEKDSHLASYIDFDYFQHIVYLDVNQHVNQIYYPNSGTSWTTQDLTGTFGGNTAGTASVLAAFPTFGDQFMVGQHVAYLDGSDNVNQLYYPASGGTSWFWQNLTAAYNGNTPAILPVFSVSTSDDSGQNQ